MGSGPACWWTSKSNTSIRTLTQRHLTQTQRPHRLPTIPVQIPLLVLKITPIHRRRQFVAWRLEIIRPIAIAIAIVILFELWEGVGGMGRDDGDGRVVGDRGGRVQALELGLEVMHYGFEVVASCALGEDHF